MTLRESTVPMVVEVHKIVKGLNKAPVLTVTGRSFETVLERRASAKVNPIQSIGKTGNYPRVQWIEMRDKASDAAYHAIRQILGDPANGIQPMLSPNDAIPEIKLVPPADLSSNVDNAFEIKPGNLYTVVMELINTNHHALKAVRPGPDSDQVSLEIYNGADLTDTVVFNAKFDQFEESTYLLSETGSTNWAYVFSKQDSDVVSKTQAPEPTGLKRRVLYVDISGEEGVDTPEARNTRGLIELYKYNATALFDGKISSQVANGYNRDYFLGDIIRLDGEYGLSEFVRISEFIRSDDSTGSKAYPTFEVVSS